jgi:hypothetical protein
MEEKVKKTRNRKSYGLEPKVPRLFTLDTGIYGIFKILCKQMKKPMSGVVQDLMHQFNVKNAANFTKSVPATKPFKKKKSK